MKCLKCGAEFPDFDVAHVCAGTVKVGSKFRFWEIPIFIHGYMLQQTCSACPEQYDVYAGSTQVAYFRLRHGHFYAAVPDVGGEIVYAADPEGDGIFTEEERVKYLTEAVLAVQEYFINRRWHKGDYL